MDINKLLADFDEWLKERIEILTNIHKAAMSGEISRETADEARRMIATEEAE